MTLDAQTKLFSLKIRTSYHPALDYRPFLLLLAAGSQAQTPLKFDKHFVEYEDKWVVFRPDEANTHNYGFLYIDEQAGLTLQVGGRFTITKGDAYVRVPQEIDSTSTSIKVRLQPNRVQVALLPPAKFTSLKIKAIPDWLRFYKADTAFAKRLYHWGFLYNSWDEPARALPYL